MGARRDILEEHAEEAAFLYRRLRRSCRLLDGNARQTRSLLARIDAHLDALALFAEDTRAVMKSPAEPMDTGERFVATALAARTGDGLIELAGERLDHEARRAVRDACVRYPTDVVKRAVEVWLAEGSDAARAVGVELLARWRDPRAAQVASRAVRRGEGMVRVAGACALGQLGEEVATDTLLDVMRGCAETVAARDEVLDATVHAAPARALEVARRWDGARCDMAWVLLALTGDEGDRARLLDALGARGAVGALAAAVALAGAHPVLDAWWERADELAVSNALREAAYVVLGGEAPPAVVRDDMAEEPEDRAQREREDVALRAKMATATAGAWRWGERATIEALTRAEGALGPRPRRWCLAALKLAGRETRELANEVFG